MSDSMFYGSGPVAEPTIEDMLESISGIPDIPHPVVSKVKVNPLAYAELMKLPRGEPVFPAFHTIAVELAADQTQLVRFFDAEGEELDL